MKETLSTTLARIEQKLTDMSITNDKAHEVIEGSIKDLTGHVNHEIEDMCARVKILEDCKLSQDAINKSKKDVSADKYQKLREYALLVGFAVSVTSIITFILNHPHLLMLLH